MLSSREPSDPLESSKPLESCEPPDAAVGPAELTPGGILERISDAFLALDARWRITYLNEKAAHIFGRRREELIGAHLWTEMPEGIGKAFYNAYHQALAQQTPLRLEEYSTVHRRWYENAIYPSPDGLSIFFQDVTERRETQRRLEESEQRFRSLYDQNPDAVYTFDLEGRFQSANAACEAVSGYAINELLGMSFLDLVVPEERAGAWQLFLAAKAGSPQSGEVTILHKSGRRVAVHVTKIPILVSGDVAGVFGITKDISERKAMEKALRVSEDWWRAIAETVPVAMTITRWEDSSFLFVNQHFYEFFGLPPDTDMSGRTAAEFFVSDADRQRLRRALADQGAVREWECPFCRTDGSQFWASGAFQQIVFQGQPAVFAAYHDVTQRKQLLTLAQDEADRDPLTGLLNHRAFHKRFEEEARRALDGGFSLAVAVLDLDNFKFFNDSYGHPIGDEVLRQVAAALRETCRSQDSLARFGGDEFALLLPDVGAEITADEVAARLEAGLRGVSYLPPEYGSAIPISLSFGVALFPADGPNRSVVMQLADERLLRSKSGALSGGEAQQIRAALADVPGFPMLDALVNAVNNKDRYTRRHSEDVMAHSLLIARALGLDAASQRRIALAALLHDVGKIGIPDAILRKPGALTDAEFTVVQQHPVMGAVIVAAVPGLEGTLDAVRHHHERWDGGGYPDGLSAEQIPLPARLMAVADAYSAMTADRPYRKGKSPAQAQSLLEAGAGTQWDPACVAAFLNALRAR